MVLMTSSGKIYEESTPEISHFLSGLVYSKHSDVPSWKSTEKYKILSCQIWPIKPKYFWECIRALHSF